MIFKQGRVTDTAKWGTDAKWKTPFLEALREGGLAVLTAYALAVGCDYGTKVKDIGPKTAVKCIERVISDHGKAPFENNSFDQLIDLLAAKMSAKAPGAR